MKENEQVIKITKVSEITGFSIIECHRALKRTDWNIQNAVSYLCNVNDTYIEIGMTQEIYKDDKYPSIKTLINKPIEDKNKIIEYMKQSKIIAVAPAIITDLINPDIRFAELFFMTDSKYAWRSDVIYYLDKYDMELPEEFIQHALNHL